MSGPPGGIESTSGVRLGRRVLLRATTTVAAIALGACTRPGSERPSTTRDPARVTTTGGEDVEVLVAQMVVRDGDDGPRVFYRLANRGPDDATVSVKTVLAIDGGGTYEATAFVDVPAGDEVTVEYRVVRYAELSDEETTNVRRGDADFSVFVDGEPRAV